LEERWMLSATPYEIGVAPHLDAAALAYLQAKAQAAVSPGVTNLLPVAPFDLEDTFSLHSDLGATKTIYLDFDGHITSGTQWNNDTGIPNLQNFAYDTNGDYATFSDPELESIQLIWEKVAEDFRPFDVDVTTENPGVEALRQDNSGSDNAWGIRVVIGGSAEDWLNPTLGRDNPGIAFLNSFSWDTDTPVFVFSSDLLNDDKFIAEAASHEVGHSLGLHHDGQIRFWHDVTGDPFYGQSVVEYYEGHGAGITSWAPIMGSGYVAELTQWSFNEYWNGRNVPTPAPPDVEDDLAIITSAQNGFGYRADDHGNDTGSADFLLGDTVDSTTFFEDEGIIEQNTDIDYFTFTVDGLGGIFSLDVTPFENGPNLDVKATIRNSAGAVIATSNPLDDILAGGQTLGLYADGGWETAPGQFTDELFLAASTYYVTVEGAERPTTFIDPAIHPGPVDIVQPDPDNPVDPLTLMPPDTSDWGYTKYGSLGYYSITGELKQGLVIGVDFDEAGGTTPLNWNLFTGGGQSTTITDLISEAGASVPYDLTISTTGPSVSAFASLNPIDPAAVPDHALPLDELSGYIAAEDETWTFTWSDLEPWSFHEIYVFGHADFDARNMVTITGGDLGGTPQTVSFNQTISADGLVINDQASNNDDLATFSTTILSDANGQITITVTNAPGFLSAIAGLAIVPTRPIGPPQQGSISGQKWNDEDGDQNNDFSEDGLPDWTIYLDLNNNGELDLETSPNQTITMASPDVPQGLQDYTFVKSELDFQSLGTILDVNVALDISHTYDSDLHVVLISPAGTRVTLFANVGPNGVNFTNTVLDDAALIPIGSASPPFTGSFQPQEPLNAFNGENSFGKWQLEILDDSAGDVGTLNSWSLTFELAGVTTFLEPFEITDANGFYSFDNLDPGVYYVREFISPDQAAAGWKQTWAPPPTTLTSGATLFGIDFGNWIPTTQRGSIEGYKYYDANQNGIQDNQEPGLPGWIVYVDSNGNNVRDIAETPTVIPSSEVPQPIVDFNTITSQVTVPTLGTVFSVEVTLDITHSFVGDLTAFLRSPSGRDVLLFDGVGGQYNNFTNLTFSDSGARSIATLGFSDVPYTGTWQPEGLLSDFSGEDSGGTWTLIISDTTFADQGTLNSWSLSINTGELFRTTDSTGYYKFDNLLPGAYNVREEQQAGWVQVPPQDTDIPAATWANSQWNVTVSGSDDPNDPDGPTSKRLVQNIDFGNYGPVGGLQGTVYSDANNSSSKDGGEAGLSGWTVFIDTNGSGTLDLGAANGIATSNTATAINNAIVATSQLWFGGISKITDVNVSLDITHTYDADLTAHLISPAGTRVKLFDAVGGSDDNFTGTTFDDAAVQPIAGGSAPFTGLFIPAEALSAFNGENSNGFWTLEITDNSAADDGSLDFWSLEITGDELSKITDSQGNYAFTNLVPGNYQVATVPMPGWTPTQVPGVTTVNAGQTTLAVDFGFRGAVALEGDFNRDNVVDDADYVLWRKTSGSSVPNFFDGADGNGNGVVDQPDYEIWRANYGRTLPPPASGSETLVLASAADGGAVDSGELQNSEPIQTSQPATASLVSAPAATSSAATSSELVIDASAVEPAASADESARSRVEGLGSSARTARPAITMAFADNRPGLALDPRLSTLDSFATSLEGAGTTVSSTTSDLALLALLSESGADSADDGSSLVADDDVSDSDGDESDSLDAYFETLEGSALAAAAI
jgi:subtilisin-like proprotein convertase family protein